MSVKLMQMSVKLTQTFSQGIKLVNLAKQMDEKNINKSKLFSYSSSQLSKS